MRFLSYVRKNALQEGGSEGGGSITEGLPVGKSFAANF